MAIASQQYNVGGILLARPFKVRRLGHFGFNALKMAEGLNLTTPSWASKFRRTRFCQGAWHARASKNARGRTRFFHAPRHRPSLVCAVQQRGHGPPADRKFRPEVTINQITWQVGSLKEVVDAFHYFQERDVPIQRVGRDMPGSNWHCYVYDPDGHTNEFYYGIEQVGWNDLEQAAGHLLSWLSPGTAVAADV